MVEDRRGGALWYCAEIDVERREYEPPQRNLSHLFGQDTESAEYFQTPAPEALGRLGNTCILVFH
jgi:hypothetical protein